jgi:hypothetical protein
MAKAAEYFAEYMLEEVKRMSEGKSRIDHGLLYDCISRQFFIKITRGRFLSLSASYSNTIGTGVR